MFYCNIWEAHDFDPRRDRCLSVRTVWNKFARRARDCRFAARVETDDPPISELLPLDDHAFRARFRGTPIRRTGRDRFVRNVLIAAGNSGDATLVPKVVERLGDASPLVRAMAIWALDALAGQKDFERHRVNFLPYERDDDVRREWATGTGRAE